MKTTAWELYSEVVVNITTAGIRRRIISLIALSKSWKDRGMNDCNIACFYSGM